MSYIYVGGDSFCYRRENPATDWPLILANELELKLTGQGFSGSSWWPVRDDLLRYKNLDKQKFDDTKIFVFCHTEVSRIHNSQLYYDDPDKKEEIYNFYMKYIYDETFHRWSMLQWFNELNNIVADKNVIHLFCFRDTEILSSELNGIKFKPNLFALSRRLGVKPLKEWSDCNLNPNHFSPYENTLLASFLSKFIRNNPLDKCANNYFQIKL